MLQEWDLADPMADQGLTCHQEDLMWEVYWGKRRERKEEERERKREKEKNQETELPTFSEKLQKERK